MPNTALDLALRAVPMPRAERCGKALCRWINAIYGCTHTHDQLDDATHDHARRPVRRRQPGRPRPHGHDHAAAPGGRPPTGDDVYTAHPERLRLPILLVQGEQNYIFQPEGSMRTLRWLQTAQRAVAVRAGCVLPGYAHLDALIGRDAAADVFPLLSEHLDRFNR